MVPADVGVIQLAQAIAPIHIHRVHMEPLNRAVRDLQLQLLPRLGPLEPILGLFHHHTTGPGNLGHVPPRVQVVKWGGAGAIIHCRIGVAEPGRPVCALALGGAAAGPIPLHAVDGDELSLDLYLLVRAGQIVVPLCHLDGNCGGACGVLYTVHRHLPRDLIDAAHGSHTLTVGDGGDHAVPLPGHREFGASGTGVQGHSCGAYRHYLVALGDGPSRGLAAHFAVPPLVVGVRCKGGGVSRPGVDLGLHRNGHLIAVIIAVPGRGLGVAVVLRHLALLGHRRQAGPANGPVYRLLPGGAVRPHAFQQGKGGGMGARVGLGRHRHRGILLVKVVPLRRLRRARIDGRALLYRDGYDNAGDGPDDLLGPGGAVPPLVVGRGGEGGGIVLGICAEPLPADDQLAGVVVVPGGRLGLSVGRQHIALLRRRSDDRPVDDPAYGRLILPSGEYIAIVQNKLGGIGACIDAIGFSGNGHLSGAISGPRRRLGLSVIGQNSILNRDGHLDGVHRHRQACGLGHALVGVLDLHCLLPQCGERVRGVGVSGDFLRGFVRISGCDHHSGRIKGLQILVCHLCRVCRDGDGHQHLLHRHGYAGRLGDPPLRVSNGHLRDPIRQNLRRNGVAGHV